MKLIELLDERKKRAIEEIEKRYKDHKNDNYSKEELDKTSQKIGYSAI